MPDDPAQLRLVLTTTATREEAARLGRTLIEERLAACATLLPAVQSIYRWKGQVEDTTETLLLLKTAVSQLERLEVRLHKLHSYETPEFLALEVSASSSSYLSWLLDSMREGK